ncbi:hypothetical protein AQB9606_01719 [Aquabacterium sp. CECT 9606]|nr:hypothetical protein AQB9606_01719 [Aquabacterium sp. CECT 9606]
MSGLCFFGAARGGGFGGGRRGSYGGSPPLRGGLLSVLGHGGRLRNSLACGPLRQSSPTPRGARGNPPWPVRLDAPEVAPPASAESLIHPAGGAARNAAVAGHQRGETRAGWVSGRAPCWCRGAQRRGGRAKRASSTDLSPMFERSAWKARREFRRHHLAASTARQSRDQRDHQHEALTDTRPALAPCSPIKRSINARLPRRPCLEPLMHPQILSRPFQNLRFDDPVQPRCVCLGIRRGKVFDRR